MEKIDISLASLLPPSTVVADILSAKIANWPSRPALSPMQPLISTSGKTPKRKALPLFFVLV